MAADRRTPRTIRECAPAKVNLFLHLTGRRADGYHLLDGLVAFTRFGDRIAVRPAARLSLSVVGPFAEAVPPGDGNLALSAATALRARIAGAPGAAIRLEKRVPVAAGLGGGSSDAAAVLRALARLWRTPAALDLEGGDLVEDGEPGRRHRRPAVQGGPAGVRAGHVVVVIKEQKDRGVYVVAKR